MKIRLGRRSIEVRFSSRLRVHDGLAWKEHGEIAIHDGLQGRELLETILHEAEHMAHPDESERNVTRNARFYADLLWRLGYRKVVE